MNILTKMFFLFREQPSEPFREESIESAVHEPSSDRKLVVCRSEKKSV